jgi:hypothetical protein
MLNVGGTVQLTASDLVGHLNCRYLTSLDLAVANGKVAKPRIRDPVSELLAQRGALHEEAYVGHLMANGFSTTVIDGVGVDASAVAQTLEAMKAGAQIIVQGARDRGKYLTNVFTMALAFKAAGYPKPEPGKMNAVSGFEDWSRMVQQLLIWLDMKDPLGAMEEARAADPVREKLQRLLDVLKKYREDLREKFNAADCERLAEDQQIGQYQRPEFKRTDLRELMTNRGRVDTTYFGRLLRQHVGQWYNNFRYVRGPQTGGRASYKFEDKTPKPNETPPTKDPDAF